MTNEAEARSQVERLVEELGPDAALTFHVTEQQARAACREGGLAFAPDGKGVIQFGKHRMLVKGFAEDEHRVRSKATDLGCR